MFLYFLTDTTLPKGDPYALALVIAIAVIFTVWYFIRKAKNKKAAAEAPAVTPIPDAPKAPGAAGQLKLHNVEPKTAAMVMAIVADKMGKPLNELRFLSIKEVE